MRARRRIHAERPRIARPLGELTELRPGVYLFTPDWAVKRARKGKA